jgi:hypothetical protein
MKKLIDLSLCVTIITIVGAACLYGTAKAEKVTAYPMISPATAVLAGVTIKNDCDASTETTMGATATASLDCRAIEVKVNGARRLSVDARLVRVAATTVVMQCDGTRNAGCGAGPWYVIQAGAYNALQTPVDGTQTKARAINGRFSFLPVDISGYLCVRCRFWGASASTDTLYAYPTVMYY